VGFVRRSLVEDNQAFGVFALGADMTVEGTIVRATRLSPSGDMGIGVFALFDVDTKQRANVAVFASTIVENHSIGVGALGADMIVDACDVSHQKPRAGDGFYGRGIQVQLMPEEGQAASGVVTRSLLRDNFEVGILGVGAALTVEDTRVEGTKRGSIDQELGDGISIASKEIARATAVLRRVDLIDNERAAVGNFGGDLTLGASTLDCNKIDLHGDEFETQPFSFHDETGNVCGCDGQVVECRVLSAKLSPPGATPVETP
jgi:hypothetical protein